MLWFALLSCGEKTILRYSNGIRERGIEKQLRLVSLNDRPQIEIEVRSDFDNLTTFTEEDGITTLFTEPNAPFVFTAIEGDSLQHRYVGQAPNEAFAFDALFLDRGSWLSLLGGVGLEEQIGHGHLWISIVDNDFNPIPEATATLDVTSDPPFVLLETNVPWAQDNDDDTGKKFVLPNISTRSHRYCIYSYRFTMYLLVAHPTQVPLPQLYMPIRPVSSGLSVLNDTDPLKLRYTISMRATT